MTRPRLFVVAILLAFVAQQGMSAQRQEVRARVSSVAKTELDVQEDIKAELKLGRQIAANILGKYGLYNNDQINDYISKVGHSLTFDLGRKEIEYYFSLVDTDDINAYATPGGYIFVTKGLLKQLRDESELAAVLAHEIVHVNRKHVIRALNVHGFADSQQRGIVSFIGGVAVSARVAFTQAVESAMQVLFSEGLNHEDEFESDRLALLILHHVGYEPAALPRVLKRLTQTSSEYTEVIRKTHPSFEERLATITDSEILAIDKTQHYARLKNRFVDSTTGLK